MAESEEELKSLLTQFIVIHPVKGFGIVNKTEIHAFLELSCFFHDPADVGNLIYIWYESACNVGDLGLIPGSGTLAPHERLPEILVVPREKTPTGAAARGNP